jgi:lipopolysaccharide transport system permease protein
MNKKTRQQIDLLRLLIKKEITLKYKRTYLGFFWSLLNPLLTSLVLFLAFKIFMRFDMKDYTLFLLSALFPWTWFSASVTMSTYALTGNITLIKKIIFPKHFLVLATIFAQLVNLLFAIPIIILIAFYYHKTPSLNWLVAIPILIIIQFITTYGVALLISMVNAFFRDMEYIVGVGVSMLFWITPILYPLDQIPSRYHPFLALNPVTYLIQSWRNIFFSNTINWLYIGISLVTAIAVYILGVFVFQKMDKKLDEVL